MTLPRNRYQVYIDYLKSDHWKNLRIKALKASGHTCESCYKKTRLVGHHLFYRPVLEDALVEDIMILCSGCHDFLHKYCKYNRIKHPTTKLQTQILLADNLKLSPTDMEEMRKDSRALHKAEVKAYRKMLKRFSNFQPSAKTYDMIIREITELRRKL